MILDELKTFADSLERNDTTAQGLYYNRIRSMYRSLTEVEQDTVIRETEAAFGGRDRSLVTVLSIFTADNKSHLLYQAIADASCRADLNPEELLTISLQLGALIFTSDRVSNEPMYTLYDHMLCRFTKLIGETGQYIPASERCDNRVVILTEQLLKERHSPTQVVCNLKYYLERAGYDVDVLVTNFGLLECPSSLWRAGHIILRNVLDVNSDFKIRLFDQEITGRNIVLQDGMAFAGIMDSLNYIKNISPAFVISVGGNNVIADLASRFITVIVSSLTAKLPITRSKLIMNDKNMILPEGESVLRKDIVMIECNYTQVLRPKPSGNEELIGLIKCYKLFKVLIVGNRLDEEIDEEFEKMLKEVVTEYHDIIYIIVGICDAFKNRIASFQYKENFVFVGYVGNLEGLTSECDVFLNPRRKGGGFSSKIALIQHIPIITQRDCDVYMWCGDAFAVNDIQKMKETLIRYHNDPEFMNTQIKACEDRCADIFMTEEQSIDNVKAFCDEVKGYM